MPFRLPGLTHLRGFEAAARHQSFTAAAEELGLTQSAVSKKIRELETDLGFALFQRAGRGIALTPAGQQFAARISADLSRLQKTVQEAVAAGAGKSVVSVAVLPAFASLWLIPRLPGFFARHPGIELSFATRLEPFDFSREPFDLAFHYGRDNWPGTRMTHLFGERMIPVCAPAFKSAHGLDDLANLERAPLVHLASRSSAWAGWAAKAGIGTASRRDGLYFDQHAMVISAAAAGLGAALVPLGMAARELESGQLVRLDGPELTTGNSYYLVRPDAAAAAPVLEFEAWVRKEARAAG
ncbi:LysR substrate-binding domain-containing protein [Roseobacteraceae bacterium NS-SX3]